LVKAVTSNPRLITKNNERYWLIHNVLQPIWHNYPHLKAILEDSRRKNKAGQDLLESIDFLKSMGFRHDTLDTVRAFEKHLGYLKHCGMQPQLDGFFRRLVEMEIVDHESLAVKETFERFIPFWRESCQHLFRSALLSLEDQKYWAWLECEKLLQDSRFTTGSGRYHHILVDEFQDINPLDLALLKAVAALNKARLTIVGDDDQAIYEWRGATPEFILEPDTHLGGRYQRCNLSTNYRSPKNIVALSQKLIGNNKRRVRKDVSAHQTTEAHVEVRRFESVASAISSTLGLVRSLLADPARPRVALIGRKRSQIIPYQIVFAGQGIPFYAAEDLHVLLSEAFKELKEILAIQARSTLRGLFAGDAIRNVLKLCDKVKRYPLSKKDRESLQRHLYKKSPATLKDAVQALLDYTGPLKGSNEGGRMSLSFAEALAPLIQSTTVSQAIQAISENFDGLQKDYGKSLEDIFYADPPFLYLSEYAKRYGEDFNAFYGDIEKAIATLARIPPESDDDLGEDEPDWKLPLHLMTALRAKGKEFDAVIILDANDGVWPSELAETDNQREQERRLFYVAVTRARRYLYFIVNDNILGEACHPTPYLAEMGLTIPDTIHGT
jgi:DNA helicase-2/ATP-dependent DNA helicase PcrA